MATVNQLGSAANMAYGDGSGVQTLGPDWVRLPNDKVQPNAKTVASNIAQGYQGAAWFNPTTGEVIIANRGTVPQKLANDKSDFRIAISRPFPAQDNANTYADDVQAYIKENYSQTPIQHVYLTGHSLGGAEAQTQVAHLDTGDTTYGVSAVVFDSPGAAIPEAIPGKSYKVVNISSTADIIHDAGRDLNGTVEVSLETPQSPLRYLSLSFCWLGPLACAVGGVYSVGTALSAHGDAQVMNSVANTAMGYVDPSTLTPDQVAALKGMTANQYRSLTPDQQDALPTMDGAGIRAVTATLPPDAPVFDGSGYNQWGYDRNGYDLYGRNAAGFLDPAVASSGATHYETTPEGTVFTVVLDRDGSSTTYVGMPDDTMVTYTINAAGEMTTTTTTNADGSATSMTFDPVSKQWSSIQTNADGSSEIASGQQDALGNESASLLELGSGGSIRASESFFVNADGSTNLDYIAMRSDGSTQYEEVTTTNASGQELIVVSGQGDDLFASGATVTIAAGANVTVEGDGMALSMGDSATVGITGSGNVITGGQGDVASVTGDGNSVKMAALSSLTVVGDDTTVLAGSLGALVLSGIGEVIDASAMSITLASGSQVSINGQNDVVSASAAEVDFADGVAGAVVGYGNTVSVAPGEVLSVSGNGNVIDGNGAQVTLSGVSTGNVVNGSGDVVSGGPQDTVSVNGSGDVLSFGAGSVISVSGTGDTVRAANSTIDLAQGADVSLVGAGDTVSSSGATVRVANTTINLASGSDITLVGNGDTVNAAGATVAIGDNQTVTVNGDHAHVTEGAGDHVTATGDGDIYDVSHFSLSVAAGKTATLNGDFDALTLAAGGTGTMNGNNDVCSTTGAGAVLTMRGTGDTATLAASSTCTVGGANDTVTGSSDVINVDAGSTVTIHGTSDTVKANGATLTLSPSGTSSITDTVSGSSDNISIGANVNLTLTGQNDSVSMSGGTLSIGAGSSVDVTTLAAGLGVSALAAGETIRLHGKGGTVTANNCDIWLDAGESVTVVGLSDTVHVAAGDNVTFTGASGSVQGSGATVAMSNYLNTTATLSVSGDADTVNISGSKVAVSVSGGVDTVNMSSGSVSIADGAGAKVVGGADTITGGAGSTAVLNGTSDTATMGAGSTVEYSGNSNTVNMAHGQVIVDAAALFGKINGSGNLVSFNTTTGVGSCIIYGDDTTVTSTTMGNNVTFCGTNETLIGTKTNVVLQNASASVIVLGNNETVYANGGKDTVVIDGDNATVVATVAGSTVHAAGNNDKITCTDCTLTIGSSVTDALSISRSVVNGGANDTLVFSGQVGLVTFNLGDGADLVNVYGSSDTFNMSNGKIEGTTSYNTSGVLNGSGNVVTLGDTSFFSVNGGNNSIAAGTSVAIYDNVSGNTITGQNISNSSPTTINVAAGVSATVNGSNETVNLAQGASVTLGAVGSTVNASGQATMFINSSAIVNAINSTIGLASGKTLSVNGYGDTIQAGTSDTINIVGPNDTVTATGSVVNFRGGSVGHVYGTGNTGSGWTSGYGFAGDDAIIAQTLSGGIGPVAEQSLAQGNGDAAVKSEAALENIALLAAESGTEYSAVEAVLNGGKLASKDVTWCVADVARDASGLFSGQAGADIEALAAGACAAWERVSDLHFTEVADAGSADIRIGFGDFATQDTGVVGYTNSQTDTAGTFTPGTVVRIEDTSETAVATNASGELVYSGMDASVLQVLEHEIGHALGLASDADQSSVMCWKLTSQNRTLDATDAAGAQSLYGAPVQSVADPRADAATLTQMLAGEVGISSALAAQLAAQDDALGVSGATITPSSGALANLDPGIQSAANLLTQVLAQTSMPAAQITPSQQGIQQDNVLLLAVSKAA